MPRSARARAPLTAMPREPAPERYRREADRYFVDIHLRSVEQIFDLRDPAPFHERDLDDDAVAYLLAAMEDLRRHKDVAFRFAFECPRERSALPPDELEASIRAHFRYEIERERRKLSAWLRQGQIGLVTAAVVLVLSLAVAFELEALARAHTGWRAAKEGLTIFGWVALWHPLDALLFGWWAMAERLRLLRRIERAKYEFTFDNAPQSREAGERRAAKP
jgi:hypothetical protein